MTEVQADPPVSDPAHKGVHAAAILELDDQGLADARLDIAFDARTAARYVDDRHDIFLPPEE